MAVIKDRQVVSDNWRLLESPAETSSITDGADVVVPRNSGRCTASLFLHAAASQASGSTVITTRRR